MGICRQDAPVQHVKNSLWLGICRQDAHKSQLHSAVHKYVLKTTMPASDVEELATHYRRTMDQFHGMLWVNWNPNHDWVITSNKPYSTHLVYETHVSRSNNKSKVTAQFRLERSLTHSTKIVVQSHAQHKGWSAVSRTAQR